MAEIELNVLIGQYLNSQIPDVEIVRTEVKAWQIARKNSVKAKVNLRVTTENARIKLKSLYPTFNIRDVT